MPAWGLSLFLRAQSANCFLSQVAFNQIQLKRLPHYPFGNCSAVGQFALERQGPISSAVIAARLNLGIRPQPDDGVKRDTTLIRLMRGNASKVQLSAVCFRRRKYLPQRQIDQGRLIRQRLFPSRTKLHDPLILDTRIR